MYTKIIKGNYDLPPDIESSADISIEGKQFLGNLLVTDTDKRWTISDALNSRWLNMDAASLRRFSLVGSQDALKTFDARLKVKAAMFAVNFVTKLNCSMRRLSTQSSDLPNNEDKISDDRKIDE